MGSAPIDFHVQSTDMQRLFAELKAMEGSLQVELRRGMAAAAGPAVESVKRSAAWSSRIPGAVRAQPYFTARRAGVRIIVDATKAPEGRPLEHGGESGTFRHPVFGQNTWVTQPARPFFYSALEKSTEVEAAMWTVMDAVALKGGMKL